MSSPVYELLKRPDELFVVEHAHLQPRFVEDSVRFALKASLDRYPALDDDDFVFSRQLNLETIHRHDVRRRALGHRRRAARASSRGGAGAPHRAARLAQRFFFGNRRGTSRRTVTAQSVVGAAGDARPLARAAPAGEPPALRRHRAQRERRPPANVFEQRGVQRDRGRGPAS